MNVNKVFRRFMLRPIGLIVTLLCVCGLAAAKGPFAEFPDFISFTGDLAVNKTGDVAVDKRGNVYVNVSVNGYVSIWKFSPIGELIFSTDIGVGVAYGLAIDAHGDIYAAVTGMDQGVYKVDRHGNVDLLQGTDQIVAANAMTFDQRGSLYVTESYSGSPGAYGQGGIWRIPRGGEAELMLRDDLLTGTGAVMGYPIGANGIAYYHGGLYVVNSDKGFIVRIPIRRNGSLGQPDVWAELEEVPESVLAGSPYPVMGDGLAIDVFGNVYVAMVTRFAVVRLNAHDMSQETVAAFGFDPTAPLYAPLDTPNSLAFGQGKCGHKNLFVTNLGLIAGPWPGRGLVKIETKAPGLPLP